MTGDQDDFAARLRALLPTGWFASPGSTPFLDGILAGLGWLHAQGYAWVQFSALQLRLATAQMDLLDMLSADFLGSRLARLPGELDDTFRARFRREILRPKATRAALSGALLDLTGQAPIIFEPANTSDTGGYGVAGGMGYGMAGGYGTMAMPYQCLVTAYRPAVALPAGVDGYGGGLGGYGVGAIEYVGAASVIGVSDDEIRAAIVSVIPAGTVVWLGVANTVPAPGALLDVNFYLDRSDLR